MNLQILHDTISINKTIKAPVEHVFSAWADPKARSIWGAPSEDVTIEFLESNFRVGGVDVHRCGRKSNLRFLVETRYYDISRPNRLLFTERVETDDEQLSLSTVTVEIEDFGKLVELNVTVQIVSLVGSEMIEGTRKGWEKAIAQLGEFVESPEREIS
ncbi:SRPBCC family protein [Microbulbifer sp. GL-2]|uniref:SRPBCC family protein n=1 Tax=Microbulbifer sp. GL-2 TaxID=2591606 RepID=UPI0011655784|nr:SRPBCC family protein [Microbulbifer sp. GL-2]BBM03524.1 hypothetical protein GL2_35980 [Microbulbifer sp. GL-2]